jgi:hypothetical protein
MIEERDQREREREIGIGLRGYKVGISEAFIPNQTDTHAPLGETLCAALLDRITSETNTPLLVLDRQGTMN